MPWVVYIKGYGLWEWRKGVRCTGGKSSAVVRTQPTFVCCFLRTAVRRLDTGCLLLAYWPRGVRTKAGLFSLVGTSELHFKDIKAVR